LSGGSPPDPQTSLHFPNSLPPSYRLKICLANEIYEKVVSKNAENQAPEAQKYKHCLGALSGGSPPRSTNQFTLSQFTAP
jgi:hypothetical protein